MSRKSSAVARIPPAPAAPPSSPGIHPAAEAAFAALDAAGAAWSLLRGERELAEPKGDVDVLVAPGDMRAARSALARAGFVEERSWGLAPHRGFLGYHPSTDTWLKVDVVTNLVFGRARLQLPRQERVLARRRRAGAAMVLDPDDGFWLLLLHCLLDKDRIEDRHRARLTELAHQTFVEPTGPPSGSPAAFVDGVCPPGWSAAALLLAAAEGEWGRLEAARDALRSATRRAPRLPARAASVWRGVARRVGRRIGLVRGGGITVALLGPDGAGKSTLADALRPGFPVPVRHIYMGLYKRTRPRLPPGISLALRAGLQRVRWAIGRYHRMRGRIVLFDRYTHDALVQNAAPGTARLKLHRWVLARAAPPPDYVLVLDVPAETLYARKGERDVATLRAQRESYRALGERPRAAVIDATVHPDAERREAAALVWRALARRAHARSGRRRR